MKLSKNMLFVCLTAVYTLLAVIPVLGQDAETGRTNISPRPSAGANGIIQYRSYAEFALELYFQQQQRGSFGISVDPDEYVVGPGDLFTISFVSGDIGNISGRVSNNGSLFIKSVGAVSLEGLSVGEAIDRISSAVQKKFSGSEFDVQLTDFRIVGIHVIGEVSRPGVYYTPAIWRVSEVIELAGGLTANAQDRYIQLLSDDVSLPVDLVRFNAFADADVNPYISRGNTIIVHHRNSYYAFVTISGLVNTPGTMALRPDDRVGDLIDFAGGPDGNLANMMIVINSQGVDTAVNFDGNDSKSCDYKPTAGDNIILKWKQGKEDFGAVTIFGEINHPGQYPIAHDGYTLAELLSQSGGITGNACAEVIQIFRLNRNKSVLTHTLDAVAGTGGQLGLMNDSRITSRRSLISYNPRQPRDHSAIRLIDGDSLFIPRASGMVTVTGAVVSPGLVPYQKGRNVDYYLEQAGGLGFDANRERIVVINPITGGEITARGAKEIFDSEILFVPVKESKTGL